MVHDAGRYVRQVAGAAESSVLHARSRAEHHTGGAEQARQAAEEAAGRARRFGSGELLPLPGPLWHKGGDEKRAFAVAVEWNSSATVSGPVRDAAEAVMGAAGLLSAELTDRGAAGNSGWLVHPHGRALPAGQSLATVLSAVPGHPLEEVTARVLERIAYLPSAATVEADQVMAGLVVGADGSFRVGPMTGRLPMTPGAIAQASHIGAAAQQAAALRAAAAARAECERWQRTAARHERAAGLMTQFADTIQELAGQFPTGSVSEAGRAEATRAEASHAQQAACTHAAQQDRIARDKEAAHRGELGRWRASAVVLDLPDSILAVREEATAAGERAAVVGEAADSLAGVDRLLAEVQGAAGRAAAVTKQVRQAAGAAQSSYVDVRDAFAALEACRQRSGMDEAALVEAAGTARDIHEDTRRQLAGAQSQMAGVSARAGAAQQAERDAARRLQGAVPAAGAALGRVRELYAFDALRKEVLGDPVLGGAGGEAGDTGWLAELCERLGAVPAPSAPLEECAMAVRVHLAAEGDDWQLGHGHAPDALPTHQLALAGRRGMSPPAAAAQAATRLAAARASYDSAEDRALQKFVLGCIPTAISTAWADLHDWVQDINTQMKRAKASSGVGVQLKVVLTPDLTPSRALIHDLTCNIGDADRTPEQQHRVGQELLAVMRQGENGGSTDRATRLAEAIDIRNWVTVKYMVSRPDGTTEEWGRKQTTVSGGESRLVVLAPMLAALSAEYRELPSHALRLCALDEVPGEVDEQGRDGIAAYTASLDLDLLCTSHHWDGSPGAWDGIDIHDLAKSSTGVIIAEPLYLYSHELQAATGYLPAQATQDSGQGTEVAQ